LGVQPDRGPTRGRSLSAGVAPGSARPVVPSDGQTAASRYKTRYKKGPHRMSAPRLWLGT